jgi:3-hydroxybutyryl-CoA dehydrogenase
MGAQMGCEYALAGHDVALVARDAAAVEERFEHALALVREHGLAAPDQVEAARGRATAGSDLDAVAACDLAVESVPEDLALKADLLRVVAKASPHAVLATNTSSLSITELGKAIGAPERTIGTHYWNPPLLMPLVEVVPGEGTSPEVVARVRETLRRLGKRPVIVERDVPGFIWNRLQMAVLREAAWIVENGAASPETVDEVLTYGLARRWRNIGFFQSIALGGVGTWQRVSGNLLPALSTARELPDLRLWVSPENERLAEVARRRDSGLAEDLLHDREVDQ